MRSVHWGCIFVELIMLQAFIGYAWGACSGFAALALLLGALVGFCLLSAVAENGLDEFSLRYTIRDAVESARNGQPLPEEIVLATWSYAAEQFQSGEAIESDPNGTFLYNLLKATGRLDEARYGVPAHPLADDWNDDSHLRISRAA